MNGVANGWYPDIGTAYTIWEDDIETGNAGELVVLLGIEAAEGSSCGVGIVGR